MPRRPEREPIGDPNDPRGFAVLLARYVEWMAVHHYSESTMGVARRILEPFARWCGDRGVSRPAEISREHLEQYQRWLYHYRREGGQALSVRTQRQRLVRLQAFFRWMTKERYLAYDPASAL
jgi:integrase/recombinase XerD